MMHRELTRPGRFARLGWGAAAALVLLGCEGENLFTPGGGRGPDGAAPTVEIQEPRDPAANPIGDSLLVAALVEDNGGVDSVRFEGFSFRGDAGLGTDTIIERFISKTVPLDFATDTIVRRYLLPTPDSTRESAVIVVTAFDHGGNFAADTLNLRLGAPRVRLLNVTEGQRVLSGLSLAVRIEAFDPNGIVQVQLRSTGADEQTLTRSFNPPQDSIAFDTAFVIPDAAVGPLQLVAGARSTLDVEGTDGPITLVVVNSAAADTIRPSGKIAVDAPGRMELGDSVRVTVTGLDDAQGSGVARVGYTAYAISPTRGDTLIRSQERTFTPSRTGNVSEVFAFAPFNVDSLALPDTLVFEVVGYLIDEDNNCAAVVASANNQSLACLSLPTGETVALQANGERVIRPVVAGRTVRLPGGGRIMDAVVDTTRRNLWLSNIDRDQVEVFRLQDELFMDPVPVGAEPWGLTMNRGEDTLIVANSGGTNMSNVWLGPTDPFNPYTGHVEDGSRRFLTPDVYFFDVERALDDTGAERNNVFVVPDATPPGFSDRPQYAAVDSTGRILYSTKTSLLGDLGTIRRAFVPAGGFRSEVVMFFEHASLVEAPDFTAIGNIDDVGISLSAPDSAGLQNDLATLVDHVPGTNTVISAGPAPLQQAIADLAAAGSDVVAGTGRWNVPGMTFLDTTFVAASGDRGWVVFGEGSRQPVGRIMMYQASTDRISDVVAVTDLMTNPSEEVRGIGLNNDGTLGVARGNQAYFFSTDLRLQGIADLPGGGSGAALHPLHANYPTLTSPGQYDPDTHLAFLGTGEGTIDIIDAFHFNRLGRIFIRDVMTGPLRAALPFPEDNLGLQCLTKPVFNASGQNIGSAVDIFADASGLVPYPVTGGPTEDRCVVLKLYGVTSGGGVVVIDVRKGDILKNHPAR
ncbi:MAG: hypothetical protein R3E10_16925 [Gemmatimonadota bacterium]